jgi:2-oxoglutarate ferredoxin oxidoreductase subunit alpha
MTTIDSTEVRTVDRVVIRFAGDSGDGMQLTGDRFTAETAGLGNDLSTLPNFPPRSAPPRAPCLGVSSFQLHFADHDVLTPGDAPDVLVAMNPAALKANLATCPAARRSSSTRTSSPSATSPRSAMPRQPPGRRLAGGLGTPQVPLTSMTVEALATSPLTRKEKERAKNMFALGLLSWMYSRPRSSTPRPS